MSESKIFVKSLSNVRRHPNADKLDIGECGGWQVIIGRYQYQNGDLVSFIEPGIVLLKHVSDALGVTKYLRERVDIKGERVLVVDKTRLRGEPSFGIVAPVPAGALEGDDVTEHFFAYKYEPPVQTNLMNSGKQAPDDQRFSKYVDIQNARTYGEIFHPSTEVYVVEKIHGTNSRVGFVWDEELNDVVYKAGSRRMIRKLGEQNELDRSDFDSFEITKTNELYWRPYLVSGVTEMFKFFQDRGLRSVILYGELYGGGIQKFDYGSPNEVRYVAFDLCINGEYLDYEEFSTIMKKFDIPQVPLLSFGLFGELDIPSLSEGPAVLWHDPKREPHIREGVVVRPVYEFRDPRVGRAILKYVSNSYLFDKVSEADTTDM